MRRVYPRLVLISIAILPWLFVAADWPQFLGPDGSGVSDSTGLPTKWGSSENVVWKTEIPGFGASSPIVVGKRVFVTCYSGYGIDREEPGDLNKLVRRILCYDLETGDWLWSVQAKADQPEADYTKGYLYLHGYASSTPASDGESVFCFFGRSGVAAFSLEGKPLWYRSVGEKTHEWGSGNSPLLYGDTVIVNASIECEAIVALNKKTENLAPSYFAYPRFLWYPCLT